MRTQDDDRMLRQLKVRRCINDSLVHSISEFYEIDFISICC